MISQYDETKQIDNISFFSAVKETLEADIEVRFTVTGMSMWPFFTSGRDSVTVKKATYSDIRKGDIILFSPAENIFLLHRVISIGNNNFTTAGDGNCFKDGIFASENVIAKVYKFSRKGKNISIDNKLFKALSKIWLYLFPIRKPVLAILKKLFMH